MYGQLLHGGYLTVTPWDYGSSALFAFLLSQRG